MSGWDDLANAKTGGGVFLNFDDGKTHEVVFRGEPRVYYTKYQDPNKVEYDSPGDGLSLKFRINAITLDENKQFAAKIIQSGSNSRDELIKVRNEYGLDCVYKVRSEGTGTKKKLAILFKEKLNEDTLAKINAIPLKSLKRQPRANNGSGTPGSSDCPF